MVILADLAGSPPRRAQSASDPPYSPFPFPDAASGAPTPPFARAPSPHRLLSVPPTLRSPFPTLDTRSRRAKPLSFLSPSFLRSRSVSRAGASLETRASKTCSVSAWHRSRQTPNLRLLSSDGVHLIKGACRQEPLSPSLPALLDKATSSIGRARTPIEPTLLSDSNPRPARF